jgi:predicted dehydrogenase
VNSQNDPANGQWRQIKTLSGGGSLPDVGLYCLSTFRYITGEEPTEVTGNVTRPPGDPRFREIEDIAQFTMRFPPGVFASAASGYSFHEDRSFRVHATDGRSDHHGSDRCIRRSRTDRQISAAVRLRTRHHTRALPE